MEVLQALECDNIKQDTDKEKEIIELTNEEESNRDNSDDGSHQEPPAKMPRIDSICNNIPVELFAPDTGPKIYDIKGNNTTPPLIASNLAEAFKFLPIYGKPKSKEDLEQFYNEKLREFVGSGLNDDEFNNLAQSCSPQHLKTGNELKMPSSYPSYGPLSTFSSDVFAEGEAGDNLCIVKKFKLRMEKDSKNAFLRTLKYRSIRLLPTATDDAHSFKVSFQPLQPGKDLIFKIRVYRPFQHCVKDKPKSQHSIINNDIVMLGRHTLAELRDRIVCANDTGMRVDMSKDPDEVPTSSAKDLFRSGFLFINNTFYVDERPECRDMSAPVRAWAQRRGLGVFPRCDMGATRLDNMRVRLGHPDVYVHQGNCEHLFTFSEVRLLGPSDPPRAGLYPHHTAVGQNHTIYCTTCAEFGAKWVVTECAQVPFDPAYFCDTCLRMYLYKDGKKVCDFKAYSYRGNEINILKPHL